MASGVAYDVTIDYRMQGIEKALGKTKALDGATKSVARSLEWMKRAALAAGASFVFGKVKSLLIDSNKELESMQIGMQTVLATTLRKPFEEVEGAARRTVEHYREVAKMSPGVAADFLEFHNLAAGAVLSSGGSLGDLKKITEGGVIAAKAFGFRGDVAGRDVQQALTNKVTMQTPLIKMLAGSESAVKKINATQGAARVAAIKKLFDSPVMAAAAAKYGDSFEGRLSTLQETASNTFRAIGRPLFEQLTEWLRRVNDWADRNSARISAMATSIGQSLASGAKWLVSAVGFMVEHKGVFLALGGAMLIGKGMSAIAGTGLVKTLSALIPNLGTFGLALTAASAALYLMAQIPGGKTGVENVTEQRKLADVRQGWGYRERAGTMIDVQRFGKYARNDLDMQSQMAQIAHTGVNVAAKAIRSARDADVAAQGEANRKLIEDAWKNKADKPTNPKVNVTIKRVEVVADDADRFIHSLNRAVGKELASPSQSVFMPRGNV